MLTLPFKKSILGAAALAAVSYATISYVGGVVNYSDSAPTSLSVSLNGTLTGGSDSSPSEDDIVVVSYGGKTGNTDVDMTFATSGYTEVLDIFQNDSAASNLMVGYKVMGATVDTSVQCNGQLYGTCLCVQVFRNVDTTTPLDVTHTTATSSNSHLANPPSITPSTSGAWVVTCGLGAIRAFITSGTSSKFSSSDYDASVGVSSNYSSISSATMLMGYDDGWTSGARDHAAYTSSVGDSTQYSWAAAALALRPATL